ncbi:hypothetical protein [Nonomuraea endophytica]|uniref:Secreted protein n=1 Tax=Nonomuraea endophytica TaxID=714136 RepID=A0A7W8A4D1_9ACTN|nr:hypothetical protein [Nonomuraea endophytica]MBB5078620.1 hypothetical protein [Nonomuraea endophytica]
MKKSTTASIVAAAALITFTVLPGQTAQAATTTCTIKVFAQECNTGIMPTPGNVMWTEVRNCYVSGVGSSVRWKLVDIVSRRTVASGTVPWGKQFQKSTTGLYSEYRLELYDGNPGARGRMLNTNPSWGGGWSNC